MIDMLNQVDHQLMLWLNYDGGAMLDAFWYAVSYKFSWIPLYVAILCALVRKARFMSLQPLAGPMADGAATSSRLHGFTAQVVCLVIVTALIIVAADQLSSGLIKPLVQRLRPSHEPGLMEMLHYVDDYRGGMFGFVSSHAANTIALAVWVTLLFRQWHLYWAMGTFYVVNCYSRIYLGVHYPGDILCGSVVGALCGWLGYTLYNVYLRRQQLATTLPPTAIAIPISLTFWASLLIMLGYAMIA